MTKFKTKLDSLANNRYETFKKELIASDFNYFRQIRGQSLSQRSCSSVISVATTVVSLVVQSPHSNIIHIQIQKVLTITITCTTSEKAELKKASARVSVSITHVQAEVSHIQEVHKGLHILKDAKDIE